MHRLSYSLKNIIIIITLALSVIVTGGALLCNDSFNKHDGFLVNEIGWSGVIVFIGAFFIFGALFFFFKRLKTFSQKQLNICTAVLFFILIAGEVLCITLFNSVPGTDSYTTLDEAVAIKDGFDRYLDDSLGYFEGYSNNNLFVLLNAAYFKAISLFGFKNYYLAGFILNALIILISYFTVKKLFGSRRAVMVLTLGIANPVYCFLIQWIYTCISSLLPMTLIIYLGACIFKESRKHRLIIYGIITGFVSAIGYFLRPTVVFPIFAFAVCAALFVFKSNKTLKQNFLKAACAGLSFLVVFSCTYFATNSIINSYVKDPSKNLPLTHWLMMGLKGNGSFNDDDYQFTKSFDNTEEMEKANINEIKSRVSEMGTSGVLNQGFNKLLYTWSNGSYKFYRRISVDSSNSSIYNFVCTPKCNAFITYLQSLHFAIMLLVCVSLCSQLKRAKDRLLPFTVMILGGMVFYTIWEAKPEYSIPFIFILLILAADGFDSCLNAYKSASNNHIITGEKISTCVIAIMIIATAAMFVQQYNVYVNTDYKFKDYSIYTGTGISFENYPGIYEENSIIEQEIYISKPINTIELSAEKTKSDSDAEYKISIYDGNKNILLNSKIVSAHDCKSGKIKISFDSIGPSGHTPLSIKIEPVSSEIKQDSIYFKYIVSRGLDRYDGVCTVNGEEQLSDLNINVYNSYSSNYYSKFQYILCMGVTILFELLLGLLVIKDIRSKKSSRQMRHPYPKF